MEYEKLIKYLKRGFFIFVAPLAAFILLNPKAAFIWYCSIAVAVTVHYLKRDEEDKKKFIPKNNTQKIDQ